MIKLNLRLDPCLLGVGDIIPTERPLLQGFFPQREASPHDRRPLEIPL